MANKKKVAPSPVDEKVYDVETTYYDYDDKTGSNGHKISVNKYIPYQEMGALIHSIVDTIIDDNGYYPYVKSIGLWGNIIEEYTNYNGSYAVDDLIRLLAETNIITVLEESISAYQLGMIVKSVDKLIEYRKQHSIKSEIDSTFTGLLNDFRSLLAKANNFLDLDPDVLGKVVNNLAGMTNITESKLVDALLDKSGVTKGKGGRKAGSKDNVVELPPIGQQKMDGSEVTE